jgi:hypothetical protein
MDFKKRSNVMECFEETPEYREWIKNGKIDQQLILIHKKLDEIQGN